MCGRAGRYGMDATGESVLMAETFAGASLPPPGKRGPDGFGTFHRLSAQGFLLGILARVT
jgi:hypothetical protein